MGISWLVIVAAEILVGGTGLGYFVWNEWNNLSITSIITAIIVIGFVGIILDQLFGLLQTFVSFGKQGSS
jgi:nitrate/nitrite transport system permease protein